MNTNNDVKWRRFVVPKKVEQINDHLCIDTYKSKNIKIGVNDMTVNDSEMSVRWKKTSLVNTGDNSPEIDFWSARRRDPVINIFFSPILETT